MRPVLSRAQMRAFDSHAIESCRAPGVLLMENAGRAATDVLEREMLGGVARGKRAVVVCGIGNNGGDGLALARHLLTRGGAASVLFVGNSERIAADARVHLDAWVGLGGALRTMNAEQSANEWADALADVDVVVDALLGTGLARPVDGILADAVRAMNASGAPRFAVDVPSGLDADTGSVLGVAVRAAVTATFAHLKLGLLTPSGASLAGKRVVVDIGVPGTLDWHGEPAGQLLEENDLRAWIRRRDVGAHKNGAGHVLVLGGSRGKTGASKLVARGAMRAGAGLATIATWPDAAVAVEATAIEAMTLRMDPARIADSADLALAGKHAVVVGPGFGVAEEARAAVLHVLQVWRGPLVVDADAITVLAGHPEALKAAARAVLTPHPGELARLLGRSVLEVETDRFRSARDAVGATGAVVVLKGAHTVIASPDGRLAISPVACPALAIAGSGDVLGGVIAALACSLDPFEAACGGPIARTRRGGVGTRPWGADRGMLASEIADGLPTIIVFHDAKLRSLLRACRSAPRHVRNVGVDVGEPREDEKQVAQPIEVHEDVAPRRRVDKGHDKAFGSAAYGARHVESGGLGRASGKHELAKRRASTRGFIDCVFETSDVRFPEKGNAHCAFVARCAGKFGSHREEIFLDLRQKRVAHGFGRCRTRSPDGGVRFVDGSVGLDAEARLGHSRAAEESRGPVIASLRVKLHRFEAGAHDARAQGTEDTIASGQARRFTSRSGAPNLILRSKRGNDRKNVKCPLQ